jgi:hypothetical protein
MDKYYWYSFSYNAQNQGVCLIKADSIDEANDILNELQIAPKAATLDVMLLESQN